MSDRAGSLAGCTVVVTRPAHQAENLCRAIEAEGGEVLRHPVIEILPPADSAVLAARLASLTDYAIAVFISANAVDFAYSAISKHVLPEHITRVAVGRATARALAAHGQPAQLEAPPPHNSEALLSLPQMQAVQGLRVLIFRGEGGRGLLADSLRERGAEVDYAEVYRRRPARSDPRCLYRAWEAGNLDVIVLTSNEGLQNLYNQVDAAHRSQLLETPLVVIGERTAQLARQLGFSGLVNVAHSASDASLLEALRALSRGK